MQIRFRFDLAKAIELMVYVATRLDGVDKIVLTKYLYLADRDHFLRFGYPVTGDRQVAIKWGPVPSTCLKLVRGEANPGVVFKHLHVIDNRVSVHNPISGNLSSSEIQIAEAVLGQHRHKNQRDFVREMHELPEYKEAFVVGTSRPITYESILKHYAQNDPNRWWKGRPVITTEMAARMNSPFDFSEPNL